jgi:hypothetical protein
MELKRHRLKMTAVVSMCIGAGTGASGLLEIVN